jgi:hypothetical protein
MAVLRDPWALAERSGAVCLSVSPIGTRRRTHSARELFSYFITLRSDMNHCIASNLTRYVVTSVTFFLSSQSSLLLFLYHPLFATIHALFPRRNGCARRLWTVSDFLTQYNLFTSITQHSDMTEDTKANELSYVARRWKFRRTRYPNVSTYYSAVPRDTFSDRLRLLLGKFAAPILQDWLIGQ